MYWGFSESLNLEKLFKKHIKETDTINILLYGNGDPRHILKTIAETYQTTTATQINFYMVDGIHEILARNILLIAIALENENYISVNGKTHLFMDIYGNSLIRPFSHNYICSKAKNFIKIITDFDYCQENCPIFDFNLLQYRERDYLENIFKFWLNKKENIFNITKYWEMNLRNSLKNRYDYRKGVFDWDLMMRLKDHGAQQICAQEYGHWRETGIAFTFPEFEYNYPNKTLAAGLIKNGDNYRNRGYCGDMNIGPYATFGLDCDDKKMLISNHGTKQYRSTDVTFRNLYELFYQIAFKKEFIQNDVSVPSYGAVLLETGKTILNNDYIDIELQNYDKPLNTYPNISIKFISINDIIKIGDNHKFQKLFDVIVIGRTHFKLVDDIKNIFKENILIIFETNQISTDKKEDIAISLNKIKDFGKDNKLELITNFNINRPYNYVMFKN